MKNLILIAAMACACAFAAMPRAAAESTAAETKDDYVKKTHAKLDVLSRKIDVLAFDAKKAGSSANEGLDQTVKELKARRKTAKKDLTKLKRSSGNAWADLKTGVDKGLADLKEALDKAVKE
jgi:curli biogenesis system outer membrane secretion channel CsgG